MNKQLNYQFNLDIQRVYLYIGEKCEVKIWWKKSGKGGSGIATQKTIRLNGNQQYFDVNEELSIAGKVTIQNGVVKDKLTLLRIMIFFPTKNQNKLGGQVYLNLSEIILLDHLQDPKSRKYEEILKNCPVSNSRIVFIVSANPYKQEDFQNDVSFQTNNFSRTSDLTFRAPEQRKKRNSQYSKQKKEVPMQFSFNPSQSDREKLGINHHNNELVKQLKEVIEQRNMKIRQMEKQIDRIKNADHQKNSEKALSLMNELNTTMSYNQQIKKQNNEILGKLNKIKEEKIKYETEYKKLKEEREHQRSEVQTKLQNRQRMIDDLSVRVKESEKKVEKLQNELFKKESDLINLGKQNEFKIKQLSIQKNMLLSNNQKSITDKQNKLKSIEKGFQELKGNYEQAFVEKQNYRRGLQQIQQRDKMLQINCQKQQQIIKSLQGESFRKLEIEKKKYFLLQANFKEKQALIYEIQKQFKILVAEKDEQGQILREKFNAACQKIDQLEIKLQSTGDSVKKSYQNQISSLNVRIKSLQQICSQLERELQERDEVIQKAKAYVKVKDEESQKKDELLSKAKSYIQNKEKQFSDYMNQTQNKSIQQSHLKKQIGEKQKILSEYISDLHKKQRQIQDMQRHIDYLRDRITGAEDHIDELERKNESQQETLKDLVKKNLDMEIQINIKNYEIDSLKSK